MYIVIVSYTCIASAERPLSWQVDILSRCCQAIHFVASEDNHHVRTVAQVVGRRTCSVQAAIFSLLGRVLVRPPRCLSELKGICTIKAQTA